MIFFIIAFFEEIPLKEWENWQLAQFNAYRIILLISRSWHKDCSIYWQVKIQSCMKRRKR